MIGWVLEKLIYRFPIIMATVLWFTAGIIFIVGFSRRGFNFLKYGFGKMPIDETLEKRLDRLEKRLDSIDAELRQLRK